MFEDIHRYFDQNLSEAMKINQINYDMLNSGVLELESQSEGELFL